MPITAIFGATPCLHLLFAFSYFLVFTVFLAGRQHMHLLSSSLTYRLPEDVNLRSWYKKSEACDLTHHTVFESTVFERPTQALFTVTAPRIFTHRAIVGCTLCCPTVRGSFLYGQSFSSLAFLLADPPDRNLQPYSFWASQTHQNRPEQRYRVHHGVLVGR